MDIAVYKLTSNSANITLSYIMPFNSLVWQEGWQTAGQAQAVFAAKQANIDKIKVGVLLGISLSTTLMYVHSIKIENDQLWAYGIELKGLFEKQAFRTRANDGGYTNVYTDYSSSDILENINQLCLFPFYDRQQNTMSPSSSSTTSMEDAETLADCMTQYMALEHCGYRLDLKLNGKAALSQINGVDRSATVRLATALGNVKSLTVTGSDQKYFNRVTVIGKDEAEGGFTYYTTVDRSGISSDALIFSHLLNVAADFPRPADMSQADYYAALQSRGQAALNGGLKHKTAINVNSVRGDLYGNPLGLGDIITVVVPEMDLSTQQRVTGVQFTVESDTVLTKLQLGGV